MTDIDDARRSDLARVSAAAVDAVAAARAGAALASPWWPESDRLIHHLGRHFGWVSSALRSTEEPPKAAGPAEGQSLVEWFSAERDAFTDLMNSREPDHPAWTFVGPGHASFWFRRSTFEVGRHLWDLRTADDPAPPAPSELPAERYADGVTEHFDVFLNRSRSTLDPLPAALELRSSDTPARWVIGEDWSVSGDGADAATVVTATAGDLALMCWERADPFKAPERFVLVGPPEPLGAFTAAPIHR